MEYLRLLSPCPPRSIYETAFCPALTFPDSLEVPPPLYLRFNGLFLLLILFWHRKECLSKFSFDSFRRMEIMKLLQL